ncbi:MAG TPA: translocation protein TolB, partial [Armatimonadota bacterium]|nr:translocation protein TolB [Armatimonadota bacterium]
MKKIALLFSLLCFGTTLLCAQDWIHLGTGLGVDKIRMAVPDFHASTPPDVTKAFNETLWNDLESAGIFEMVSKSFYPLQTPGSPREFNSGAWGNPPPNAAMVAFGNLALQGGSVTMQGWLFEAKNPTSPQVLGKQYRETGNSEGARTAAHKFADEIIFRLGGGINGIAQSKIVYVCGGGGHKEICEMDYDGANQHRLTHLGTIALSPRISPDGSRVAFSALARTSWEIMMYSRTLGRMVSFPHYGGTNLSPAWSPNGSLAFSSSRSGDPEIYIT